MNALNRIAMTAWMTVTPLAFAQQCSRVTGQVVDGTDAVIVGASVQAGHALSVRSDARGRFTTGCLADGVHSLQVSAAGFEAATVAVEGGELVVRLKPSTVETVVEAVDADGVASEDLAGSRTLRAADLKDMADDPDELARQLQVLAATSGGAPGAAIIAIDGFQNGGRIPPKSAIAFIRVNPDLFAAEYERPPYQGGRIEIYTKPGLSSLHGALFTTQSGAFLNAKDPFATSRAAIGKQRYGFEFSGPIKAGKSDFAVALEHRQINQFAVVNAVTLDEHGDAQSTVANVATPQTLWQGSARMGFLLSTKNNATLSYTATVNSLLNQDVGGTTLEQAGRNTAEREHTLRFTNLQTISARVLLETRVGYTWRYRQDTPASTLPSVQVAGAFTSGGVTSQALNTHERDLEFDDDVMYTAGKHSLKAGVELLDAAFAYTAPGNFNGTYTFGGGVAPNLGGAGTAVISGLEQYRRALLGLAGGTPTTYSVTSGKTQYGLNQLRVVLFVQDQWKVRPRLQVALGVRWAMQNAPVTVGNVGPRVGISYAPDKAQRWVFHLRSGLFFSAVDAQTALEAHRLNGTIQTESIRYSPVYGQPLTTGSAPITTLRTSLEHVSQTPSLQSHVGLEHEFKGHWHAQGNLYLVRAWNVLRSANINAPVDGSPTGPRPLATNENLDQYQQSGTVHGNVMFLGVDQHSLRRLQVFAGYIRMDLRGNADDDGFFPQANHSNAGEIARPGWEATHHGILFSTITLPQKVALTTQFDAASGVAYNVTTGFDNNGDGVFNDRPFVAQTAGPRLYATRFGQLTAVSSGTTVGRNAGSLPWNVHLDLNLSRTFAMTHPAQGEAKTLAVNVRSTNALNHENVTAVGGVLGSPLFGQAYAAGPGRRIEAGLRYSF